MTTLKKHVPSARHVGSKTEQKIAPKALAAESACDFKTSLCNAPGHLRGDDNYHPYVNHAACVEHQLWWRNPKLVAATVVAGLLALGGLTSTFMLVPGMTIDVHHLAFVPFATSTGTHRQEEREFQLLCKRGQDYVTRGQIERGLGEFKKAEAISDVSEKLKAELLNDIAVTLHASGHGVESVNYLERAIKNDPELIAARSNLAMVLIELGEKDKAISVLKEAIRLAPSNSCLVHRLDNLNATSRTSM